MGIFDKLFGGKKTEVETAADAVVNTPETNEAPVAAPTAATEAPVSTPDSTTPDAAPESDMAAPVEESTQVGYGDEEKA